MCIRDRDSLYAGECLIEEHAVIQVEAEGGILAGNEAWVLSYREECFEQIGLKPSIKIPVFNGSFVLTVVLVAFSTP